MQVGYKRLALGPEILIGIQAVNAGAGNQRGPDGANSGNEDDAAGDEVFE
jgi:hypothetical protein